MPSSQEVDVSYQQLSPNLEIFSLELRRTQLFVGGNLHRWQVALSESSHAGLNVNSLIAVRWLRFFLEDDDELKKIEDLVAMVWCRYFTTSRQSKRQGADIRSFQ